MAPEAHYRAHNSPPTIPILSQINPIHALLPYFYSIHFNIILPTTPCLQIGLFLHVSPPKSRNMCHMPRPSHLLYHQKNTWWAVQIIKLLIMGFLHSPVTTPLMVKYVPQHSDLERRSLRFSCYLQKEMTHDVCRLQANSKHEVHAAPQYTTTKIFQIIERSVAFMNESFSNSRRNLRS